MTASGGQLTPAQLRTVALFAGLVEDQLSWLAGKGQLLTLSHGAVLFDDGEPARRMYIVLAGELLVTKVIDGCDEVLARHCAAQEPDRGPSLTGPYTGELPLLTGGRHVGRATAVGFTDLVVYDQQTLLDVVAQYPQILRVLMPAMAGQIRGQEQNAFRQVVLRRVNALTTGFAHELNNQAAAVKGSARQSHALLGELTAAAVRWGQQSSEPEREALVEVLDRQRGVPGLGTAQAADTPLDAVKVEESVADWLAANGAGGDDYETGAILSDAGLDVGLLEDVRARVAPGTLEAAIRLVTRRVQAETLADELASAGSRIEDFIRSAVTYANMDVVGRCAVHLAEGVEATLAVLAAQLAGIRISRDYTELPPVTGYPAELNEVWTDLVGYIIAPMRVSGDLSIIIRPDGTSAVVEIADGESTGQPDGEGPSGPSPDDQETGPGLHACHHIVSVRHQGSLDAQLGKRQRKFVVRLPLLTGTQT